MGRPATGQTPVRAVRIPDEVWDEAKANAKRDGHSTMTDLLATLLASYNAASARRRKRADNVKPE